MNKPPRKLVKSSSAYELTPEMIYDIVMGKDKGGIQGYQCPRHYYDYHQVMWLKKREEILKRHKAQWPPEDWKTNKETGSKEPPKKTNFIDDQIKWAKSFNDPNGFNFERSSTYQCIEAVNCCPKVYVKLLACFCTISTALSFTAFSITFSCSFILLSISL